MWPGLPLWYLLHANTALVIGCRSGESRYNDREVRYKRVSSDNEDHTCEKVQ